MVGMLRILGVFLLATLLAGCNYDGSYRYPCQDPANWESEDCKPPLCTTSNTCPTDLNSNLKNKKTGENK